MAGVQIAWTHLIRIGDTVQFEEDWGTVEDITYTYVVIRTWDQRRVAVPNHYIISNPLENWAMIHDNTILPVVLHVDSRAPIEVLRRRYVELLEATGAWDRAQAPELQVRVLCSAENAHVAWDLHRYLREKLVAFLRDWDDGRYLPRSRVKLEGDEAHRLARELAALTGESLTATVTRALHERLVRERAARDPNRYERLLAIGRETAARLNGEVRTVDHADLLYDGAGLPHDR